MLEGARAGRGPAFAGRARRRWRGRRRRRCRRATSTGRAGSGRRSPSPASPMRQRRAGRHASRPCRPTRRATRPPAGRRARPRRRQPGCSAPLPYDVDAARCHGTPWRWASTAAPIASPRTRSVCSSRDSCSARAPGRPPAVIEPRLGRQHERLRLDADASVGAGVAERQPGDRGRRSGRPGRPHRQVPTSGTAISHSRRRCSSERTTSAPSACSISVITSIVPPPGCRSGHLDPIYGSSFRQPDYKPLHSAAWRSGIRCSRSPSTW